MSGRLTRWNQYGFETDVFDKYREAVKRSNRASVKVLGAVGLLDAVAMIVYGFTTGQKQEGILYCLALLAMSVFAVLVSRRKESSRKLILFSGYCVTAALYAISIYGTRIFRTDAFWVGTQIAVGVYLLDYAWRLGLLQLISYAALIVTWIAGGQEIGTEHMMFSLVFLAAGLVTFYTMNRTRASLIMGREESQRQAETDLLTGLTNRTAAQDEIEDHLNGCDETGVLMLLDLDRFKSVNDRLGHQMGDKVLIDIAADLKKMFRNTDVLSRLGGDEFIIYMKAVPEKEWARQRAEQVVREVRRWIGDGTTNIQVTASVGVVTTEGMERVYQDLYRAADIAMYFSKAQGGNKAVFYSRDLLNETRGNASTREDDESRRTAEQSAAGEDLR